MGKRVQSGKVVDPGSSPSSCGHSQFPLLYNELLGPFSCHVLRSVTGCLLETLLPSMVERQRSMWGEGRRDLLYHAGPWSSCTWEIQPSPAQMLA